MRWMSGVVNAQLPGFFGRDDVALEDLTWCLENADQAPHLGWSREVYYHLARIYRPARRFRAGQATFCGAVASPISTSR